MHLECDKKFGLIFYGHSVFNFPQLIHTVICEDILMRCDVNSIFDCAGVLKCTPSNQVIEVCKQVAK